MTESEFLALEPRERDKVVAMGAMDNKPLRFGDVLADCHDPDALGWLILTGDDTAEFCHYPPSYTTDISAAWQVVEAVDPLMGNSPWDFVLARTDGGWICNFHAEWFEQVADGYEAPTAPLAICIAALRAKRVIE